MKIKTILMVLMVGTTCLLTIKAFGDVSNVNLNEQKTGEISFELSSKDDLARWIVEQNFSTLKDGAIIIREVGDAKIQVIIKLPTNGKTGPDPMP